MNSPTVRLHYLTGFSETATWGWFDEYGVQQGEETGQSGAAGIPPLPDPLTVMVQTALDHATYNGINFSAVGKTYASMQPGHPTPFLQTWDTIKLNPVGPCSITFDNVMSMMRPANLGDGLVADSSELINFENRGGEFFYRGPKFGVRLKPTTLQVLDNNRSINSARNFDVGSITVQSGGPTLPVFEGTASGALALDLTNGGIFWNNIAFSQLGGHGVGKNGIVVSSPPNAETVFKGNKITGNYMFGFTENGVLEGGGSTYAENLIANQWNIGSIFAMGPNANGFNTFGRHDFIDIGYIKGPLNRGLLLEPSTVGNIHKIGIATGATDANIMDAGTGNKALGQQP